MSELRISSPLTDAVVRALHVGERVLLSGAVYTARDAAHKRMVETLNMSGALPFALEGQIIYYVGPSPTKPGDVIGSAGPTTAGRVDDYTIPLLARGLKGMIGKGKRSASVRQGMIDYGAVYLVAVGGAAALIADRIKRVDLIAYEELGTEAIRRFEVEDFPLVVANDVYGMDLYEAGKAAYRQESP
ncbi:MAG: Fe-S-containing hydro-lyase [Chloroflexota bacterium]|nr:Fe-S-containing hydro-lyase [Chloroflexota bacterium]